ncbi:hypothetical protein CLOM_g3004, partial [Closterium sp. NIES-68]
LWRSFSAGAVAVEVYSGVLRVVLRVVLRWRVNIQWHDRGRGRSAHEKQVAGVTRSGSCGVQFRLVLCGGGSPFLVVWWWCAGRVCICSGRIDAQVVQERSRRGFHSHRR